MDNKRTKKRWTTLQVAHYLNIPEIKVVRYERGEHYYLDFVNWVLLASFYGKEVLSVPFVIHRLEQDISEEYFMFIRNGETIEYAAKKAVIKLRRNYDSKYTN